MKTAYCKAGAVVFVVMSALWTIGGCARISQQAHLELGVEYALQGDFVKARDEFVKIPAQVGFDPEMKLSFIKLADDAAKGTMPKEGALALFKVIAIMHGAQKGSTFDIISLSERVIVLRPDSEDAYFYRGTAYQRNGLLDKAIADYKRVLAINPTSARAHYNLGGLYLRLNNFYGAIDEYQKALQVYPDLAEVHYALAIAYSTLANNEQAVQHLDKALALGYLERTGIKIDWALVARIKQTQ
jgi:tetratricopeptide (TPR) repeat protein